MDDLINLLKRKLYHTAFVAIQIFLYMYFSNYGTKRQLTHFAVGFVRVEINFFFFFFFSPCQVNCKIISEGITCKKGKSVEQ